MALKALDVPPYRIQPLIAAINESSSTPTLLTSAQALGLEVYVGCSNGDLLRYALQAEDPTKPESYTLLSRQTLPNDKPIEEIRPAPSFSDPPAKVDPIEFCVIKRNNIALYSLRERLFFQKEIPLPQGATLARRIGRYVCVADKEFYNIIDLEDASLFPLLPLSQAFENTQPVKPFITVIDSFEFLALSFTETGTLGVFVNSNGEPVRGTLQWPSHPEAICLDYPYIATLLVNGTIEIHSVETQELVQVVPAPSSSPSLSPSVEGSLAQRLSLVACLNGYMVPSPQRSNKMRLKRVSLVRKPLPTLPHDEPESIEEKREVDDDEIADEKI
ncbi:hypothetical protein SERLA73DRAFT_69789 [Serpula lacrymans var. lacrymans S7.3]|uniref:CNH domain-containing protein n=2 Tax=Serpula lacrymans var. lacrymans TaxID=341189 RepID=F8PL82_SERL3|nr:uncharacterized protein SERLADRAFT_433853 [Serpula lacrymans var. lacrymans S7.9]EGO03990.1 hypothetical protein SERLA73DRAFT_69789 [Serpula lacrymans var. lacrymans S7.3]EGO29910.1 hypothetical protein SERLADRAFT_433853 [Serpula lacrymans var. lacrymans S7.9]